eukprot:scaffold250965_cov37-Prasinocladus_malaysianus.AAC.1
MVAQDGKIGNTYHIGLQATMPAAIYVQDGGNSDLLQKLQLYPRALLMGCSMKKSQKSHILHVARQP